MMEMFRYLTGILEREEQKAWKILAIAGFISPIADLFNFSVIIYIINIVLEEQRALREMGLFALLMGLLSFLKGLFDLYKSRIHNRFLYNGAEKWSEKLYELLLKEDLLHHNQRSPMQAAALIRSDTQNCMNIIADCTDIWINALTMAGYFAVMIYSSKWFGLISSISFVTLMAVLFFYYQNQIQTCGEKSRMYTIKANAQVTIAYGNFKEMKIAGDSSVMLQKYQNVGQRYTRAQKEFQYKKSIVSIIMQNLVMTVMFLILAWFLINPGKNTSLFLASMVVYLTMLVKMLPIAYGVISGLNNVKFSQKSYEVFREGMERYREIKEREKETEKIRRKELTFHQGLFADNLTFAYNEQRKIFENASVHIPAGCSVAVIGVSGIGKTTFLDLILGLLNPQEGSIRYDDYDIVTRMDGKGSCRADIGTITSYIPQAIYLNGETVCNNVTFFEEEADEEKVTECLKCAQVWEEVARMPEGIHTLIGENGTAISGGQRQRIALARALYKDFELLVMDEATAALDMETEKAVIDSIRQVKGNKTILIATHHMSLANECDVVYKIEDMGFVRVK